MANDRSSVLLSESPAYGPNSRSVIHGGWKLIKRVDGVSFLFDLEADPTEMTDLSRLNPEKLATLEQLQTRLSTLRKIQGRRPEKAFDKLGGRFDAE